MVSLVVPVYNVKDYLAECLDSLVNQSYKRIEILLVDDGSTDGSGAVCDRYAGKDTRIRVIHKANGGPSSARNTGIENAKGQYLMFVDSDDRVHRDMVKVCLKNAAEDRVLVFDHTSDPALFEGEIGDVPFAEYNVKHFMEFFCADYVHSPISKLYRTDLIRENKVRFPEGISLGEDFLFNLRYFRCAPEKYLVLQRPLYYYRVDREGSLSSSFRPDLLQNQKMVFEALKDFLTDMRIWDAENKRLYYGVYWDRLYLTARIFLEHKEEAEGRAALRDFLADPIWRGVRHSCKSDGAWTIKRQLKYRHLKVLSRACGIRGGAAK